MKKILMICMMGMLAAVPAHATTMCAADDTLTIVLDPMVKGISHASNAGLSEWRTGFPYGTIFGIATCITTPGSNLDTQETLIDTATGEIATGGERTGSVCWCKMTHPLQSRWVFRDNFSTVAECDSGCAGNCGYYTSVTANFRTSIIGSVDK